jgi:signal transduction histidine kinase
LKQILLLINDILNIDQEIYGEDYLKQFVKNIAKELDVKYVMLAHPIDDSCKKVRTDVIFAQNKFLDNFTYDLEDTPCNNVLTGHRVCIHDCNVSKLFPNDKILADLNIESYVGAPVTRSDNKTSSLLILLDEKPIANKEFFTSALEFLALRASAELEKFRTEQNLINQVKKRTLELEIANEQIELSNKYLEKRVQEEVAKNEQKQKLIYEQSKMAVMGEMIENIAHQWRQPLATISTISSGIKLQKEHNILDENHLLESMDNITSTTQYLSKTIDDFRDFYKRDKDKGEFSLLYIFDKTIELMKSKFKNKKIEVISDIKDIYIKGYDNEFIQVIMNLLSNANDELISIEKKRFIFITSLFDENEIIIKIRDNANGIKEEIIDTIFNPYVTTKTDKNGTGIGLYMTKQIVEDHMNGFIEVNNIDFNYENESYRGAEFTIRLPHK